MPLFDPIQHQTLQNHSLAINYQNAPFEKPVFISITTRHPVQDGNLDTNNLNSMTSLTSGESSLIKSVYSLVLSSIRIPVPEDQCNLKTRFVPG